MKSSSRLQVFIHNTQWVYLGKAGAQLFGMITLVLVIRKLDVALYGTFNFIQNLFILFSILAVGAIVNVFHRYIPELIQNGEYGKLNRMLWLGATVSMSGTLVILGLLYRWHEPFAAFFNVPQFHMYLTVFSLFVFSQLLVRLANAILTSLLLHQTTSILQIVVSVSRAVLYLIYLPVMSVSALLYIETVLGFFFGIAGLARYYRFYQTRNPSPKRTPSTSVTKARVIQYGLYSSMNELGAGIISKTSDYYIISALSTQYFVGLYAFAYKIYEIVYKILPVNEFLSVLRPLFFQKFSADMDQAAFTRIYNFMVKIMLPVCAFPALYFLIFGKPVIHLIFDPKYMDAYWVTTIVLTGNITFAIFYPLGLTAQLLERMDILFYSKTVVVFSIIGGIYAMKFFGIVGVALATLTGGLLKMIFIYIGLSKHIHIQYTLKDFKNYIYIAILLIGIFYPTGLGITTIYSLVGYSLLFGVCSAGMCIMFHGFDAEDLNLLNRMGDASPLTQSIKQIILAIYRLNPVRRTGRPS
ncbi:MAG: hypothetical protein D6675_09370 [Gemmatimonadetes bacterium]|nr:MAG: hypothetical protein D6675_09370 [Gemmatimonadota bacterium]